MQAITRGISDSMADCELTHLEREPIDVARARDQHAAYVRLLDELGAEVTELAADHDHPDCVFIEDTAVVVDEIAVITRPGADARHGEVEAVAAALHGQRPVLRMIGGGRLDGGDVLIAGDEVYVGTGHRSDAAGAAELRDFLEPLGYRVIEVAFSGCLHLKTAVTKVREDLLLINPAWASPEHFAGFSFVEVHREEPMAGNALQLGDHVVIPESFPRTAGRLHEQGLIVHTVEVSELQKAEGGVTCCSLLLD